MISARGVTRSYLDGERGAVKVLDGVDLSVEAGELVAVVGRSGSGKSTLLHVLAGLDREFVGSVSVGGVALSGASDATLSAFRNQTVGLVFQAFHLVPGLSVEQNVLLPASFGAERPQAPERARQVLREVGLGDKLHRRPGQLSGGERQRVAIARALLNEPKVLLCDEPTGNLDADTAGEVLEVLARLHRAGLTVVAVTHEPTLRDAATRVLTLHQGKLS